MTFTEIPAGASVFLDANVLIYHFAPDPVLGPACSNLLNRIRHQEIEGFTATHVLSETAYRLMAIEAIQVYDWPAPGIAQRLRKHPAEVRKLTAFRRAIQEIHRYGIRILTIPSDRIYEAAALSQQTGLLSNDALIVAMMQDHGLVNLASHDTDFDRVSGITRYAPA